MLSADDTTVATTPGRNPSSESICRFFGKPAGTDAVPRVLGGRQLQPGVRTCTFGTEAPQDDQPLPLVLLRRAPGASLIRALGVHWPGSQTPTALLYRHQDCKYLSTLRSG